MRRALVTLLVAPFLASLMFGVFALVAFPIMALITVVLALPLFFFLRRVRWLQWWHAVLAGSFCGLCFAAANTLGGFDGALDRLVNSNNVYYVGLGALVGFVYWWLGIFRNPSFPFVASSFPWSVALLIPVAVGGFAAHVSLQQTQHQGRALSVLREPTKASPRGEVSVKLTSGAIVAADFGDTWARSMVIGKCFHVAERWSTLRFRRIYELVVPFGGDVDDC